MTILALLIFLAPFLTALAVTSLARRSAQRLGLMDDPGHRKVHDFPTPRNGGLGIFAGVALPLLAGVAFITFIPPDTLTRPLTPTARESLLRYLPGMLHDRPLALLLIASTLAIHLLGLLDDRKTKQGGLPPLTKLLGQFAAAVVLVGLGELIEPGAFRTLTALDSAFPGGFLLSSLLSILWIVALTNAFNFLDNMDGLSAGVAFIAALMFLIAAYLSGQWFICGLLILFMGSTLGFLVFNFPPASIFMGDGGSMVLGFFLSALTIRTTYYQPPLPAADAFGATTLLGGAIGGVRGLGGGGWWTLFMPLIVLAVPLYDLLIVSILRIVRGRSPMTGDTNHFSHRLLRHGFSKRGAVLVIYALTFATGISAPLLSRAKTDFDAALIALQVLAMLLVIAFLERVGDHTT